MFNAWHVVEGDSQGLLAIFCPPVQYGMCAPTPRQKQNKYVLKIKKRLLKTSPMDTFAVFSEILQSLCRETFAEKGFPFAVNPCRPLLTWKTGCRLQAGWRLYEGSIHGFSLGPDTCKSIFFFNLDQTLHNS